MQAVGGAFTVERKDLARWIDLTLKEARDLALDLALARARARARALDLARARDRALGEVSKLLRQSVRMGALALVIELDCWLESRRRSLAGRFGLERRSGQVQEIERLSEASMDVFIDFCLLEERIEGVRPAVEGIRIVRERRREEKSDERD